MSEKLSEVGRGVEKGSCREVQTWRVRVSSLSPPSLVDTFTSRRVLAVFRQAWSAATAWHAGGLTDAAEGSRRAKA